MQEKLYVKNLLNESLLLLEDLKANKIKTLNVTDKTSLADYIIITEGTSSRHVNSIANNIVKKLKKKILSVEGLPQANWALIDLGDIIIHIFLPEIREFYNLEKIWGSDVPFENKKVGS